MLNCVAQLNTIDDSQHACTSCGRHALTAAATVLSVQQPPAWWACQRAPQPTAQASQGHPHCCALCCCCCQSQRRHAAPAAVLAATTADVELTAALPGGHCQSGHCCCRSQRRCDCLPPPFAAASKPQCYCNSRCCRLLCGRSPRQAHLAAAGSCSALLGSPAALQTHYIRRCSVRTMTTAGPGSAPLPPWQRAVPPARSEAAAGYPTCRR